MGRHRYAAQCHQGQHAGGFQSNGLSPGIGSGNHHHPAVAVQIQVKRLHALKSPLKLQHQQQRMTCSGQFQLSGTVHACHFQAELIRKTRDAIQPVYLHQCAKADGEISGIFTYPGRKLAQDADFLRLFLGCQVLQLINEGNDFQRFHKGCFSGGGNVMHNPLDHSLGIHAHRNNPAP